MIRKIEIERFSLTSSKPFDQVVAAVNAGIGHPDMAEFTRSPQGTRSFAELKSTVEKGSLSKAGLMLFMKFLIKARSCGKKRVKTHLESFASSATLSS